MELEFVQVQFGDAGVFAVSKSGQVINYKTRKPRKQYKMKNGYMLVGGWCHTKRKSKNYLVHRLVAHVFLGPCPQGMQVNHKNGIKTDNRVENLEYVTPSENNRHAIRMGLFDPRVGKTKLTNEQFVLLKRILVARKSLGVEYPENPIIGKMFGLSQAAVGLIDRGTTTYGVDE